MRTLEFIQHKQISNKYSALKGIITAMLVLLYTYAAFIKLFDFREFRRAMFAQPFPNWVAGIVLYLIPALELITVILLAAKRTERLGYWFSFILMTQFTGYIALVLVGFWNEVPCSCGGILGHLSWLPHLFFNIFFLIISIIGIIIIYWERREGDIK
jgi:putative oxidoreductase